MMLRCYPVSSMFKLKYKPVGLWRNRLSIVPFISSNHNNLVFHSKPIKLTDDSPLSGVECVMMDYLFGKRKATEVAHSPKGDAVVDATCGNGYDTLAMANMVADESCSGHVYSLDIQETGVTNTAVCWIKSLDPHKRETVELFATCHSKMEEVVPRGVTVRYIVHSTHSYL
ncbi:putative rRNA methylase, S-adenosyl-L-methionine-dependent methyltransferase [Helianthus annuus]|nr:putative rRNA methylase, S-adenosyl-L-methionine-dependent methyltransferase [Helianthus annuus]